MIIFIHRKMVGSI